MVDDTAKMLLGADDATKSAIDKAAETTQLADRHVGTTIGGGITPPYPPHKLASFQELNTTHQVAIGKKASREVGFGFELVPHERAEDPSDSERKTAEEFWFGRDTKWRIGPQGTPSGTPTEVFELARQDWHGIGWLCIELLYGSDNTLQGLAHVPADETRVRKADTTTEQVTAGHGYVQEHEGQTVYYGEAGDRKPRDGDEPTYVDQTDGDVYHDLSNVSEAANELIFIPNPSPLSKYYGIPDWVAAIQTMVADNEAQRFNREYFEWDSMGQYFVMVENGSLTDESRETVREMIQGLREKEGRRVATLEAEELTKEKFKDDAEPASISIEQVQQHSDSDMAFHEFREFNEHKIAQAHEIPPQMIGDMESANRSNSEEAIADFIKGYIQPKQNRFAGRLYRIIHQQLLDVGDWTFSFKTRGGKNEQKQAEITNTRAEAAKGSLTVNERRDELGYEPLTDADGNELPQGRMLVSQLQQGAGGGGGGQPAPSPNVQRSIARARKTEREQHREKTEKALYGEGTVVEYDSDGHIGVVTAVMEETFTVPEGDEDESEVEASSDSPTYVVARQTGGFGTFSASDLSSGSIPDDEQGDPEDLAEAKESLKTEKDGWNTLPPGWSRLTLLDAWSSMSASYDGCMREIGDREVCASMKDEVLGTTRWRNRF